MTRRDGEELFGTGEEGFGGEAFEAVDDAVGGQDGDAGGVHVDEGHHHGGFGEGRGGEVAGAELCLFAHVGLVEGELELGAALLGVGDGGLVAMVAVGDDQLLVGHGGDDEVDEVGVGELPDTVEDVVLVGDGEVGGCGVVSGFAVTDDSAAVFDSAVAGTASSEDELFGGEGRVGVEHVDLLAVGASGLEEGEAVGLVLGEGLLVAVDDLVGVVVEVAEGDEAAALADLVGVGDGVGLGVAVEGGLGLFGEDAVFAPVAEGMGGAGVDVLLLAVVGLVLAEDDADEVVGAGFVVALLHGRGDLVVGLGDNVFHVDAGGIVTEGAEGIDAGHALGLSKNRYGVIVRGRRLRWRNGVRGTGVGWGGLEGGPFCSRKK